MEEKIQKGVYESKKIYKLIKRIIVENRQLLDGTTLTSQDQNKIKSQIKKKMKIEKLSEYNNVIYSCLNYASTIGDPDVKNIFEKVFFEDIEKEMVGEFLIPLYTMKFEGLEDMVQIDFMRSIPKNLIPNTSMHVQLEDIYSQLREIYYHAKYDYPLLIIGETGTSKELLARSIHKISNRRREKFVEINCAAIPEDLLESELFGYLKGAFTGANEFRKGLLKEADSGTVFLDEVGRMSTRLQAKLLKVIEGEKFLRLGGSEPVKIDVRFIAAAQPVDLETDNDDYKILPDLRYRLGYPDCIEIPTLNERLRELPWEVIRGSLRTVLKKMDLDADMKINQDAYNRLRHHKYEGNYRELEGILRRSVRTARLNGRTEILPEDLKKMEGSGISKKMGDIGRSVKDIKLKNILEYANKVKAEIVETKVREIINSGKDIQSVLKDEGLKTRKEYQNHLKKIKNIMGKGIRELSKLK